MFISIISNTFDFSWSVGHFSDSGLNFLLRVDERRGKNFLWKHQMPKMDFDTEQKKPFSEMVNF